MSIYRQMAAARWFAESFLVGVPWDFSGEVQLEPILAEVEPDFEEATRTLLMILRQGSEQIDPYVYHAIVHDLLDLNFVGGNWRQCTRLTRVQQDVLQCLVEIDAAWADTKRLWFLVPDGTRRLSQLTSSDIEDVRTEMRGVLASASAFRRV